MKTRIVRCNEQDNEYLCRKLVEYNLSQVPKTQDEEFKYIDLKCINEENEIIAGCHTKIYCWNVMYIDILWVDERFRHMEYGKQLLMEIERADEREGCTLIHLDTFDFQAKDFYLKYGYEIFGVLEDCPKDHCRYYLKKVL